MYKMRFHFYCYFHKCKRYDFLNCTTHKANKTPKYGNIVPTAKFLRPYLIAMVMFVLSVTIWQIFAVEMCMTLALTFEMVQGQMFMCQSTDHIQLPLYRQMMSPFARCSQSEWGWPWPWPLEWTTVEYKNKSQDEMQHFCVGNWTFCPICHRL